MKWICQCPVFLLFLPSSFLLPLSPSFVLQFLGQRRRKNNGELFNEINAFPQAKEKKSQFPCISIQIWGSSGEVKVVQFTFTSPPDWNWGKSSPCYFPSYLPWLPARRGGRYMGLAWGESDVVLLKCCDKELKRVKTDAISRSTEDKHFTTTALLLVGRLISCKTIRVRRVSTTPT